MLESVFVRRYRDICDLVRRETILGIGQWMTLKPDMFLNDQYLKYLAWALSDKVISSSNLNSESNSKSNSTYKFELKSKMKV